MSVQSPQQSLTPIQSHKPDNWTVAAHNSAAYDAADFRYAVVVLNAGTVGASGTVNCKVQESADGSTGWADVSGAAFTQVTASNDDAAYVGSIRLDHRLRYIRVVMTVAVAACDAGTTILFCNPDDEISQTKTYSFEV